MLCMMLLHISTDALDGGLFTAVFQHVTASVVGLRGGLGGIQTYKETGDSFLVGVGVLGESEDVTDAIKFVLTETKRHLG